MRLADFIETNSEPILAEWIAFAATCGPSGRAMDVESLRDHAVDMLSAIVQDLRTPQTGAEQEAKSKGEGPVTPDPTDTAAEVHGAGRAESGFSVGEMVSEYRALRASVIRLWTVANGTLTGADLDDLTRFNETIDQSLAESVERYTQDIDRSKEMFLAILGHDLRTPLNAIIMASQFMLDTELVEPYREMTTGIARSSKRMNAMVGDLLDFTRGRLGSGVQITRSPMDLGTVAVHAVEELRSAHPTSRFDLETSGDLHGDWDSARLSQLLQNLLGNAVQYGTAGTTIDVTARGDAHDVTICVRNDGPVIPGADVPGLFGPFKRLAGNAGPMSPSSSLGLGLYIVEQIVSAHGGTIRVSSSREAGTLFTVRLPR